MGEQEKRKSEGEVERAGQVTDHGGIPVIHNVTRVTLSVPVIESYSFGDGMGKKGQQYVPTVEGEAMNLWAIWSAHVACMGLQPAWILVTFAFAGHLGLGQLAGTSLAVCVATITGFSIQRGLMKPLEHLLTKDIESDKTEMWALLMKQAFLVGILASIPSTFVWLNLQLILSYVGQSASASFFAGVFAKWFLPALYLNALTIPISKFMQVHGMARQAAICSIATLVLLIPCNLILRDRFRFRFIGVAVSLSLAYAFHLFLLLCVISKYLLPIVLVSIDETFFTSLWAFLDSGMPSLFETIADTWAWEITIIFAGMMPFPDNEIVMLAVSVYTASFFFMPAEGFKAAVCARVSLELSLLRPSHARFSMESGLGLSLVLCGLGGACLSLARGPWAQAFAVGHHALDAVRVLTPLVALAGAMDAVARPLQGALKGCKRQRLAMMVKIICHWGVGLSSGVSLAVISGIGAKGLWAGLMIGILVEMVVLLVINFTGIWELDAMVASKIAWTLEERSSGGIQHSDDDEACAKV